MDVLRGLRNERGTAKIPPLAPGVRRCHQSDCPTTPPPPPRDPRIGIYWPRHIMMVWKIGCFHDGRRKEEVASSKFPLKTNHGPHTRLLGRSPPPASGRLLGPRRRGCGRRGSSWSPSRRTTGSGGGSSAPPPPPGPPSSTPPPSSSPTKRSFPGTPPLLAIMDPGDPRQSQG